MRGSCTDETPACQCCTVKVTYSDGDTTYVSLDTMHKYLALYGAPSTFKFLPGGAS
jgi:hypothetical protein